MSATQGKFVCSACNKGISNRRNYMTHYRKCVLGDEFPFKCILCGEAFKRKQNLTNHRKTCDGTVPETASSSPAKKASVSDSAGNDESADVAGMNEMIQVVDQISADTSEDQYRVVTYEEENNITQTSLVEFIENTSSEEITEPQQQQQQLLNDYMDEHIEYTPSWERGKVLWKSLQADSKLIKDYFIYFLVDSSVENMREGIFFVGKGCYSSFDGPFTDAIEWFLDIDEVMRSNRDPTRKFVNASPKVKHVWYIWNEDRGVGLVTPIQLLNLHETEVFEACLIDELGAQLANENWGTLHGIASNWTQDEKRDVAEFILDLAEVIVSRVDLQLLYLKDVQN